MECIRHFYDTFSLIQMAPEGNLRHIDTFLVYFYFELKLV